MFVVPTGRCFPFEADQRRKNAAYHHSEIGSDIEMIDENEIKMNEETETRRKLSNNSEHLRGHDNINESVKEELKTDHEHNNNVKVDRPLNPCHVPSITSLKLHRNSDTSDDITQDIHSSWMSKVLFIDICHRSVKLIIYIILRLMIVAIIIWPVYHFYSDWRNIRYTEIDLREKCFIDYEECVSQVQRDIDNSGNRLTPYDLERCRFFKECIEKPLRGGFQLIFVTLASTLSNSVDSLSRNTLLVIGGFFGLSTAAMFSLSPFSWITSLLPAAPLAILAKPLSWLW